MSMPPSPVHGPRFCSTAAGAGRLFYDHSTIFVFKINVVPPPLITSPGMCAGFNSITCQRASFVFSKFISRSRVIVPSVFHHSTAPASSPDLPTDRAVFSPVLPPPGHTSNHRDIFARPALRRSLFLRNLSDPIPSPRLGYENIPHAPAISTRTIVTLLIDISV